MLNYRIIIFISSLNFAMSTSLHNVFVYGTLKRGEPNYEWFSKNPDGHYKFIAEAKTVEKYPLIIGTKYNIPFLLYSPGNGKQVKGELYEVDSAVLANLDILEDHPKFYQREVRKVQLINSGNTVDTWIYFIKDFKDHLLSQETFEEYSSKGSHGLEYVARYLREDDNYRIEVMKNLINEFLQ